MASTRDRSVASVDKRLKAPLRNLHTSCAKASPGVLLLKRTGPRQRTEARELFRGCHKGVALRFELIYKQRPISQPRRTGEAAPGH